MKYFYYIIIIFFISLCFLFSTFILTSCQQTLPTTSLNINQPLSLIKEEKIINYGYGYSVIKDSLLTFLAFSDPSEKFIHIYDTSLHLKLSTGNKGKLFSEFNMPEFYTNNLIKSNDSLIYLYDMNLLHEKYFNPHILVSSQYPDEEIEGQYLPTDLYFTTNLNRLDDSIVIGQSTEENKGIYFTYNKKDKSKKWTKFKYHFRYPNKRYKDYSFLNSICVNPALKRIVVAFRYFDLIQIYNTQGELQNEICFSKLKKPLLSTIASCISPEASFYFLSISATAQYCYILRANKTGIELQKEEQNLSGELIVIDWEGNIKNIYSVSSLLYAITIDATDTYLYAITKDYKDPEYAYIQKYKL